MSEPRWVSLQAVIAIHSGQIAMHGGLDGVREHGYLESALARPQNLLSYEPDTSIARLAAAYAFGIASNHPFNDGNKRTAFLTMFVFLRRNGHDFTASETDVVRVFLALAAGQLAEAELAGWISENSSPALAGG